MQVVFAPPAAAVPGGQSTPEFASAQSDTAESSFAALLDSNNNPPSESAASPEPVARQSSAPLAPEDAAAGESVADDQEVGPAHEDSPSIDDWLAAAVEAAIPFQVVSPLVPQEPAPEAAEAAPDAGAVVSTDGLIDLPPALEGGPQAEVAAPTGASSNNEPVAEIACPVSSTRPREGDVAPQAMPDRAPAEAVEADVGSEVAPVSSSADVDNAPARLIPGHSDARRDEGNPAVAGAIARQVTAAPHAQQAAEPKLSGQTPPERRATAVAAPVVDAKTNADAGGVAVPLPAYPNARVIVPAAEASGPATPPTPASDAQDPAVASPVVAAPTLTQVLVEGSRGRMPREAVAPETAPVAQMDGSDTAAADSEIPPQAADDPAPVALPGAREGKKPAVAQRTTRENLAVTSGRMLKVTSGGSTGTLQRNFLNVDGERVGGGIAPVGTGAAKESQPMTAPTQVLPTVAPTSLATSEGMPTAANAAWNASPVATSHAAATSAVHAAAVEAVREAVEAAERAQQTGRNQVELRLPTSDDESLRVHLRLQDGVVHAKFVAPTTELQQALSKEWSLLAPRLAERGVKFGETSFENRDQSGQSDAQNAFASGQQRQSQHDRNQPDERAQERTFSLPSSAVSTPVASRRSSTAAPALATVSATSTKAEARGLHAWA